MAERKRIGLREVKALQPDQVIWDAVVSGFHVRRQTGTAISYAVYYRTQTGRQRFLTIGRHGVWTPDTARAEALRLLGEVAKGGDPAADRREKRTAVTMAELCDQYLADAASDRVLTRKGRPKKASTLEADKGRIDCHIKPLIGRLAAQALTSADVTKLMHAIAEGKTRRRYRTGRPHGVSNARGGQGVASRTIELLSAIMSYAIEQGIRSDNPCRSVRRFAGVQKERRLTDAEYAQLGEALRLGAAQGIHPPAIAAIRFLALSGWRSSECTGLKFADIDFSRRTATLADTKTGRSTRALSLPAIEVLHTLPRLGGGELIFPASRGINQQMSGFPSFFRRIAALAGLGSDVTPHTLRHSLASVAGDAGYSEYIIAGLLGHRLSSVTSRYTHLADASLLAAADRVAARVVELMGDAATEAEVVPLRAVG